MSKDQDQNDFASQARGEAKRDSLASEMLQFLRENRKWWLGPILASVLVLGALVLLGGGAAAPFIYTLF